MMTATLDTRKFDAALNEYAGFVQKDAAHVVNRQSLNVMIKAIQQSPVAKKEKLERAFGFVGKKEFQATRKTKSGKRVWTGRLKSFRYFSKPIANILAVRELGAGHSKYEIAKKASAIFGKRLGAIGFLRAGWIPAAKRFDALKTGISLKSKDAKAIKRFPRIRWGAQVAKSAVKAVATFSHWINRDRNKISESVLQKAINAAAVDMRSYIQKKYKETARKVCRIVR